MRTWTFCILALVIQINLNALHGFGIIYRPSMRSVEITVGPFCVGILRKRDYDYFVELAQHKTIAEFTREASEKLGD